jgi:hypothetical protein
MVCDSHASWAQSHGAPLASEVHMPPVDNRTSALLRVHCARCADRMKGPGQRRRRIPAWHTDFPRQDRRGCGYRPTPCRPSPWTCRRPGAMRRLLRGPRRPIPTLQAASTGRGPVVSDVVPARDRPAGQPPWRSARPSANRVGTERTPTRRTRSSPTVVCVEMAPKPTPSTDPGMDATISGVRRSVALIP